MCSSDLLPLDTTKVTFDVGTFAAGPALVAQGAESKATMGNGPLQDVLVLGIALKGKRTAPAPDVTLNPGDDLGSFTLTLNPAGGVGNVFDGGAPSVGYKAAIQSAAGRTQNAIAIGKLDAQ